MIHWLLPVAAVALLVAEVWHLYFTCRNAWRRIKAAWKGEHR